MRILVTGGAGFIGSNFVRYILKKYPDYEIVVLDKLTYAGRLENIEDMMGKITFKKGDICDRNDVEKSIEGCSTIFNFAAETHVDRAIKCPATFIKTDVSGTYTLLEAAMKHNIEKFIQISTDEVYGQIIKGRFDENSALQPRNPYSASKAAADLLCRSFFTTYDMPIVITRSSNNYGPYQYPEKLIPAIIINALRHENIPIYGKGEQIRDWIYVEDNCRAIDTVFKRGIIGEIYNIGGNNERKNIEIAKLILKIMNKPEDLIDFVEDRPGHDFRYSLNCKKIASLGWSPIFDFAKSLRRTVEWYMRNEKWWKSIVESDKNVFQISAS